MHHHHHASFAPSLYNWSLTNHLIVSLTKNLVLLSIAKKTSYSSTAKTHLTGRLQKSTFRSITNIKIMWPTAKTTFLDDGTNRLK